MPEIEDLLSRPEHSSLLAPAGCGKTEEIVRAVSISEGRQLILTHTNAGVASLKSRLRKFKVPNSKYSIDTIASWLLKFSAAYPKISGLTEVHPEQNEWQQVYSASMNLLRCKFIREIIQSSYSGVFIDEYQDCTIVQHNLVICLAEMLPVRVLGDPLQGIFGFRNDPLIDWNSDVLPIFSPLPELQTPWRWINGNEELGKWLIKLRKSLIDNEEVDLSSVPEIEWHQWSITQEIAIGYKARKNKGSVIGIQMWPNDAHESAKRYGGIYQSMEEMECKRLMYWANQFDQNTGIPLAVSVINFIYECMVPENFFSEVIAKLKAQDVDGLLTLQDHDLGLAFYRLVTIREILNIALIIRTVLNTTQLKIYRRELLGEMKRSIQAQDSENFQNLHDAAWNIRFRTRINGRKPELKTISRTLLIKGLEFDHAIILDASKLQNKMHFYVAATRGSQSLSILSPSPIIKFG